MGTHATNYQSGSIISIDLNYFFFSNFRFFLFSLFLAAGQKKIMGVGRGCQGMNYKNMPEISEYLPPQMN